MILNKVVIGILFNKKIFRLGSLSGSVIDEVLSLSESNKKIHRDYMTQFSTSIDPNNMYVKLKDDQGFNSLLIQPDQLVFSKKSSTNESAVSIEKTIEEFEILWKSANKILDFPGARRIGLVAENHIDAENKHSASNQLLETLVKFPQPKHSGRFTLNFEDRELNSSGEIPNKETADYWNTIYTFYPSEADIDFPEDKKINANIDVQKYYNPAKKDPLREIKSVHTKFVQKKKDFKRKLNSLGLA